MRRWGTPQPLLPAARPANAPTGTLRTRCDKSSPQLQPLPQETSVLACGCLEEKVGRNEVISGLEQDPKRAGTNVRNCSIRQTLKALGSSVLASLVLAARRWLDHSTDLGGSAQVPPCLCEGCCEQGGPGHSGGTPI